LGVLGLGGVVLPLEAFPEHKEQAVVFFGTNYRGEQTSADLSFVGTVATDDSSGWRLHQITLPTSARRAGGDLFRVALRKHDARTIAYVVTDQSEQLVLEGRFGREVDPTRRADLSLPAVEQRAWQQLFIRAEVELRWFRSVLRERDVRIGMREHEHEFRVFANEVEQALTSEEEDALDEALLRLRATSREIEAVTGIATFPVQEPLVLLPEPSS